MIEIAVVARHGAKIHGPTAVFGEDGGTIGRADTNKLVLDDPDRTISRVHVQIACREGRYIARDCGSNPLHLNGRPVGSGAEVTIQAGDRLELGGYELLVSQHTAGALPSDEGGIAAGVADDDPFAHLLDGLGEPARAPAAPAPPAPDPTAGLFPDPLGVGSAAPAAGDPFADLLPSPGAAAPAPGDFSDLAGARGGGGESIDALFGLGDPVGADPLADPLLQPNTASSQDPLAALSRSAAPTPEARDDHVPVDQFGFVPPAAHARPPAPSVPPPAPAAAAAPAPGAGDPLAGMDPGIPAPQADAAADSAREPSDPAHLGASLDPFAGLGTEPSAPAGADPFAGLGLGKPGTPGGDSPAEPAPPANLGADIVAPDRPLPVAAQQAPTPHAKAAIPPTGGNAAPRAAPDDELLAAFLRGVGTLQKPLDALTPALMQRLGELLRTATEGTLQLLHTRQEFKQEVRAQVTLIAAQANNPLKFSPTVEVALAHLLGEGVRGFMPAEAAMRDAYQDLRAHEFGVMVGMRAALDHVIRQFEPEALEENIATRSRLDAIFSANRKARLWDQFVKLYADIAREAEDDFHSLFGKAFLKAYEEQMQRLKTAGAQEGVPHAD